MSQKDNNKNSLKIAHVVWGMTNGGIENMLTDIINEQAQRHNVSLLIINDIYDQKLLSRLDDRCTIVMLKRKTGTKGLFPILRLNWLLNTGGYDIIHFHASRILSYVKVFKVPMVATVHSTGLLCRTYKGCIELACISRTVYDEFKNAGRNNIVEIDNSVNVDLIEKRAAGYYTDKLRIVQVSRLEIAHKGQDILLQALAALKGEGCDFTLDFIGDGSDADKLKVLTAKLGLSDNVRFLGNMNRDTIYANLKKYDLLVQPSRFEGFGLTVAEAMAACVPVLVSENEGPLEIIDNGEFGYAFKNGDVDDCKTKLRLFLDKQNDLNKTERALEHIKSHYSTQSMVLNYEKWYRDIIEKGPGPHRN